MHYANTPKALYADMGVWPKGLVKAAFYDRCATLALQNLVITMCYARDGAKGSDTMAI